MPKPAKPSPKKSPPKKNAKALALPELPSPGEALADLFFGAVFDGAEEAAEAVEEVTEEIADEAPEPKKAAPTERKPQPITINQFFKSGVAPARKPAAKPAAGGSAGGSDGDAGAEEGEAAGEQE